MFKKDKIQLILLFILLLLISSYFFKDLKKELEEYYEKISFNIKFLLFEL
jgi:F0F1-type ATP synthase membrane subunit b/b'